MKQMINIHRYLLIILFFGCTALSAQKNKIYDLSKRLLVGGTFTAPESVQMMRSNQANMDWKKLENKIVLLDLFETTCGTCIQTMPHLQTLRDKHPEMFDVILISPQDKETVEKLFERNTYLKEHKINLPVIHSDQYFRKLFPYRSIPMSVLVYKGKVRAITTPDYITEENIQKLYRGESAYFPLKDDFAKHELRPEANSGVTFPKLGSRFTGYQDGVPHRSWRFETDTSNNFYKSSLYNTSIFAALKALYHKVNPTQTLYIPRMDRILWNVRDSTRYYNFKNEPTWDLENYVCYGRFDNRARPASVQARIIMEDFTNFYGVKIYADKQKMPVLFLRSTDVVPNKVPADQHLLVYKGSAVFAGFTDLSQKFPPIVDEVKSDVEIKIYSYNTLAELNLQLAAYGIKAEMGEAEIDVLIVEETL